MTTYVSKSPNAQGLIDWNNDENQIWSRPIKRQSEIVKTRACDEFLAGLDRI